ncbi:HPP family protein [Saccharopolyspora erythraea]|uniref:CBS domain-containing protein n=3 Tax=Saccharopolyspora erythraea TaxID=1836 RepID=A4FFV1_SACEN|nr:CBS domain-containing protein [Saccharopolyspora erythraea]QRK93113.1 CBS domain-containing protein [Saccharopolyspora erythraea]CAM02926.1 hypothetical protein SACE_3652 [Saccharopolyspora erythraea NRRL 2338]
MRVRDIMQRPVVSVRTSDSGHQAAVLLAEHGYAALPVLGGEHTVVGMVSGGDLLRAQAELRAVAVAEVMSAPAVSPGGAACRSSTTMPGCWASSAAATCSGLP